MRHKTAPALVYEEYDLTLRTVRDSFTDDVNKLTVDSKVEFHRVRLFTRNFLSHLASRVHLYKGDDLFADKDIERQINRIFESKIYLKSNAYIIIEPTEGLVVIDVNSGGFKSKVSQEETTFKINCEAAHEVARQLRLRDLGGIIVIDFIDMIEESHRRAVLKLLKEKLSSDRAKYDILGISKFGLVEMTRERIHNTVQTLSYQLCPYCQGKSKVKTAITMSIYALRELKRFLKLKPVKAVSLTANNAVIDELLKDDTALKHLERQFRAHINLIPNPTLHIEEVKIS